MIKIKKIIKIIKKIKIIVIIILLGLLLSGCQNIEIKEKIFISALGFDYDEKNKLYEITCFSPNLFKVSSQQAVSTEVTRSIVSEKGKSLTIALKNIENSIPLKVDLEHLSSIILGENFLKDKENIDALLKLFLYSDYLHLGVYVFFSDEKMKDLFDSSLPDDTSLLYNLITNPNNILTKDKKMYSLILSSLAEYYYETTSNIIFPWIKLSDVWSDNKNKVLRVGTIKGVAVYNKKNNIVKLSKEDFNGLDFLENCSELGLNIEKNSYRIYRYKIKKKFLDGKGEISISFELKKLIEIEEISDEKIKLEIVKKIEELLIFCRRNGIDLLRIEENLYRNKKDYKNFDLEEYKIDYKIKLISK